MGFENTNFVDDLGREVKDSNPFLGCLGAIFLILAFFGVIAAISGVVTYFTLAKESGAVVFKDGNKTVTFTPPKGWLCFNAKDGIEPYVMNKLFKEKIKYHAVLETVSYKKIKYSTAVMKREPSEISKQVRSALRSRELKDAVLKTEREEVLEDYTGFKRLKCVYKNGYGYSEYKKEGLVKCYYFKALVSFMIVMTYIYDDSDENREDAQKEQGKITEMWEKALDLKNN